ncbi:hypothetical protein GCM10007920_37400 [Ciceribacter naphthalenivorans]|uniref:Uncharacterized protein n=2 Tax=Alphaproteobacteria TaxID=28211 RepID=A0A512HQ69_9HYPH|nr:hypothetical protein RNA01_45280 [Ciceribacter naphthalenivorans]GLR23946.1 hypothetical protein GCM10007920_37400 [Ciceribacter naphthalenivorans]GLT06802.1 hypothetical protein GCM10007926_37400 [Sphingomonas psychrolutea]
MKRPPRNKPSVIDSRNSIAPATSSGLPKRPIGTPKRERASLSLPTGLFARNNAVSVGPGETAFTVIPPAASSRAQLRVKLTSAAFAAA